MTNNKMNLTPNLKVLLVTGLVLMVVSIVMKCQPDKSIYALNQQSLTAEVVTYTLTGNAVLDTDLNISLKGTGDEAMSVAAYDAVPSTYSLQFDVKSADYAATGGTDVTFVGFKNSQDPTSSFGFKFVDGQYIAYSALSVSNPSAVNFNVLTDTFTISVDSTQVVWYVNNTSIRNILNPDATNSGFFTYNVDFAVLNQDQLTAITFENIGLSSVVKTAPEQVVQVIVPTPDVPAIPIITYTPSNGVINTFSTTTQVYASDTVYDIRDKVLTFRFTVFNFVANATDVLEVGLENQDKSQKFWMQFKMNGSNLSYTDHGTAYHEFTDTVGTYARDCCIQFRGNYTELSYATILYVIANDQRNDNTSDYNDPNYNLYALLTTSDTGASKNPGITNIQVTLDSIFEAAIDPLTLPPMPTPPGSLPAPATPPAPTPPAAPPVPSVLSQDPVNVAKHVALIFYVGLATFVSSSLLLAITNH